MKRFILFSLLALLFVSCNSLKRLEKLAVKHGEEITDTISIDTVLSLPGISFDTSYIKEISISETKADTTLIHLEDGTKIILIDQVIKSHNHAQLEKITIKRTAVIFREEKELHIMKNRAYKRISVTPPDKVDVFLANFKWFALSVLGFLGIILFVKKTFF